MADEKVSVSDKLKAIEDKLSTIEDMQSIIELDVINLKNEIEKLKLVSPSPIPPEIEKRIVELEKIAKDVDLLKKWSQTVDEVKFLRNKIMAMEKERGRKVPGTSEIQELKKQIAELRESMLVKPGAKPPGAELKRAIEENRKIIEELKGKVPVEKVSAPALESLKRIVEENRKSIENLKTLLAGRRHTEIAREVEELKELIEENKKLAEQLKREVGRARPDVSDTLNARITELIEMVENNKKSIEDLKVRIIKMESRGKAELPERIEDEIEELRDLLFSKLGELNIRAGRVKTEELKRMIIENRKAMEKLKERVYATRTKKGVEFPLPLKDRLEELERKVEVLSKSMGKAGLKPIKIPEGMMIPSPEKPSKLLTKKINTLKAKVDGLVKRVKAIENLTKNLVRKEDLVALERALRPGMLTEREKKMLSENVYKDIEKTKKAVLRNEDHINVLASDIEEIKKELSTIEKREWGEIAERPTLEDLARRIEEIEKKLETIGTSSPLFIE